MKQPLGDRRKYAAELALVALAYFAAAKAGLGLAFANSSVTAVWPPTGLALAALLLGGYRLLPGVVVGAFLANVTTDVPLGSVCGITVGNTLEALTGAALISRVPGFRPSLERMADVWVLLLYGAVLSTLVSATIGVASLWAGGAVGSAHLASTFRVWWLGDMGGDLLVAPALLVIASRPRLPAGLGDRIGAMAVLLGLAALAAYVLSVKGPITFVLFPLLFWIAVRYRQAGAVAASLLVSGIGIWYTARGHGTFHTGSQDANLLRCQLFAGIAAMTSLLVAAARTEREQLEGSVDRVRAAAAEDEHRRWARELHDGTLQGLSAVQIGLSMGARSARPEDLKEAIDDAVEQVEAEIGNLRGLITELRPATLDEFGVEAAILELAGRAPRFAMDIDLDIDLAFERGREQARLTPELEIALYRIVQESLNNAYKHSQAEHLLIEIREHGSGIDLVVRDDGNGFDPAATDGGYGLLGMRERAELFHGRFAVDSRLGQGTTVRASFPAIRREAPGGTMR